MNDMTISDYSVGAQAFIMQVITDWLNNGGPDQFSGQQLVDHFAERRGGLLLTPAEAGYIKRNLAEISRKEHMPLVRIGGANSGMYKVLRGLTTQQVRDAKRDQPHRKTRTRREAAPPAPVMPPPDVVVIGQCLEVLDVKEDVALVRNQTTGHIFKVVLDRIVL